MLPKSLRWRLPLSYAAIALLAALSLGAVLMLSLGDYYAEQERGYLEGQARVVGARIRELHENNVSLSELRQSFPLFSLFTQTRVQLLDAEGNVIADSGLPDQHDVRLIYSNDEIRLPMAEQYSFLPLDQTPSSPGEYVAAGILPEFRSEDGGFTIRLEDAASGNDVFMAPAPSFGFGATQSIAFQGVRSAQVARTAVFDQDNQLLYDVLVSQGPAYGQAILRSVFGGWLVASAFAIVLAAATGWIISRRISAPLVALTSVTGRMAQGDLSARACDRIGRGWLPRPLVQRNGKPR